MEPISMALLVALAGGAGGEAGQRAWDALSTLVRRPFRRGEDTPAVSSGEAELAALARAPGPERANALRDALAARAVLDARFGADLRQWHEQTGALRTGDGEVHNTISGGTFHGPLVQGRDFSGITFNTAAAPPSPAPTDPTAPQD
ncbi:hypothetical protein G3I51_39645 [Streptomyces sp. SID9944]|nr:hypothetical protein [Streptomyces sp. SID9944]